MDIRGPLAAVERSTALDPETDASHGLPDYYMTETMQADAGQFRGILGTVTPNDPNLGHTLGHTRDVSLVGPEGFEPPTKGL